MPRTRAEALLVGWQKGSNVGSLLFLGVEPCFGGEEGLKVSSRLDRRAPMFKGQPFTDMKRSIKLVALIRAVRPDFRISSCLSEQCGLASVA